MDGQARSRRVWGRALAILGLLLVATGGCSSWQDNMTAKQEGQVKRLAPQNGTLSQWGAGAGRFPHVRARDPCV